MALLGLYKYQVLLRTTHGSTLWADERRRPVRAVSDLYLSLVYNKFKCKCTWELRTYQFQISSFNTDIVLLSYIDIIFKFPLFAFNYLYLASNFTPVGSLRWLCRTTSSSWTTGRSWRGRVRSKSALATCTTLLRAHRRLLLPRPVLTVLRLESRVLNCGIEAWIWKLERSEVKFNAWLEYWAAWFFPFYFTIYYILIYTLYLSRNKKVSSKSGV